MQFTKATEPLAGKRAAEVANIIEQLVAAGGEPVAWTDLCANAGVEERVQRASLHISMYSLELVGAVDRYEYVEDAGMTRSRPAYALREGVVVTT